MQQQWDFLDQNKIFQLFDCYHPILWHIHSLSLWSQYFNIIFRPDTVFWAIWPLPKRRKKVPTFWIFKENSQICCFPVALAIILWVSVSDQAIFFVWSAVWEMLMTFWVLKPYELLAVSSEISASMWISVCIFTYLGLYMELVSESRFKGTVHYTANE